MNVQAVIEAVRTLRSQGQHISVRSVHSLTGGNFRDVHRLLKDSRDLIGDEEVAALEVDAPAPSPPVPGRVAEAHHAY